ncbi:MAG TPA: hypothetical protein VF943_11010 [Burkholderiales bacterium]
MRFSTVHRWLLVLAFAGIAISGLAWAGLDLVNGFGPSPDAAVQSAKSWLGRVHGAFAMLALAAFGSALAIHVPTGWSASARRASGLVLVVATILLAATGYLLYYAGSETLRDWSTWLHLGAGVAVCAAFGWHRVFGA